jgi:CheY-like chemotaxis protein
MARADKPRVLLIDDNEATCALVIAILHREFEVETTNDGAEAIERLKTISYAGVILDLRMPQTDGFAVLDFLQSNSPDLLPRVIVLTAAVSQRELAHVKEFPVAALILKPFDVEVLLNAVRACCGTGGSLGSVLSTGMILLIADLLRQRWM